LHSRTVRKKWMVSLPPRPREYEYPACYRCNGCIDERGLPGYCGLSCRLCPFRRCCCRNRCCCGRRCRCFAYRGLISRFGRFRGNRPLRNLRWCRGGVITATARTHLGRGPGRKRGCTGHNREVDNSGTTSCFKDRGRAGGNAIDMEGDGEGCLPCRNSPRL